MSTNAQLICAQMNLMTLEYDGEISMYDDSVNRPTVTVMSTDSSLKRKLLKVASFKHSLFQTTGEQTFGFFRSTLAA